MKALVFPICLTLLCIGAVAFDEFGQSGIITTVAGVAVKGFDSNGGFSGDGSLATAAQLSVPTAIALDIANNLYVADSANNRIRKVTPDGMIRTVAGNGSQGFGGDGGPATEVELNRPYGITVDLANNIYIADSFNFRIRKVTPSGVISTVAGSGIRGFGGDGGPATSSQMSILRGVLVDREANIYIADRDNHRIRKVTPIGMISTVAGIGMAGFSGDGGPAISAMLKYPYHLALDAQNNLFITDSGNQCIRKVTPGGIISTVAGTGTDGFGGDNGPAISAQLNTPIGIAVDSSGGLYIADSENHRIRKVTPDGMISTVAGSGMIGFSGDGGPALSARMRRPWHIATDSRGNLYIADYVLCTIRKVNLR